MLAILPSLPQPEASQGTPPKALKWEQARAWEPGFLSLGPHLEPNVSEARPGRGRSWEGKGRLSEQEEISYSWLGPYETLEGGLYCTISWDSPEAL